MRHKDESVNALLRRWGCRADRPVIDGACEFLTYDELMAFFASALRDTNIRNFTVRNQTIDGQDYDLASMLVSVDRLRVDGRTEHAAAVMRYGWKEDATVSADPAAFNRSLSLPVRYVHDYITASQQQLRGRDIPETLKYAVRHGIPAQYVGQLPLSGAWRNRAFGFTQDDIYSLHQAGVPADYAAQSLPPGLRCTSLTGGYHSALRRRRRPRLRKRHGRSLRGGQDHQVLPTRCPARVRYRDVRFLTRVSKTDRLRA